MNRHDLTLRCNSLEAALAAHRCPARVTGATVTPTLVRYNVLPGPSVRVGAIQGLSEDLARALSVQAVRVARSGDMVIIEASREDTKNVHLLQLLKDGDSLPACSAVLGMTNEGNPLVLRLASPDVAHVLIAGTTGSGKTVLLRSIAITLALSRLRDMGLVIIDPRQCSEMSVLARLPHLIVPIVRESEQAVDIMGRLAYSIEQRDGSKEQPIVVLIDELADLLAEDRSGRMESHLLRLVARGRSAGIHVIAATQKPAASVVGSLVKANFPVRLVGRVTSADDARVAAGMAGSGAEQLRGRGDFLLVQGSRMVRFQAPLISDMEIGEFCDQLGWLPVPPQLPTIPESIASEPADMQGNGHATVEELAERLRPWWVEHKEDYGSKSKALRFLFGEDIQPGGIFWHKTIAAIRLIELVEVSSTTGPPTPGSKIIQLWPSKQ